MCTPGKRARSMWEYVCARARGVSFSISGRKRGSGYDTRNRCRPQTQIPNSCGWITSSLRNENAERPSMFMSKNSTAI